jgi:beta-phosphoglucomutase
MSGFKGILFDFDGTLADTMAEHFLAWKAALGDYGISIEASDYFPFEGTGLNELARKFTHNLSLPEKALHSLVLRKKELFIDRQPAAFYPGVESLILELKKRNVPMAIVTASHLDQLSSSVPERFLEQFDALITGDLVVRGKPDPEPYLRGAARLGLLPEQCIAVENAPLGVQSARRANIYCIALCSTVNRKDLAEADEIVDQFEDLRDSARIREFLVTRKTHA